MLLDVTQSSIRSLVRSPRIASVSILLLAVGISATVVLFAVSDAVMFRPFPFVAQERLVLVTEYMTGAPRAEVSYANYRDWRARTRTFDDLAAMGSTNWTFTLRASDPIAVSYRPVSYNFFDVLGAHAARGRTFQSKDDAKGARRVVVISDGLWRRQFGADPHVVGEAVTLSDRPFTIVGVMPRGFTYPAGVDAWAPLVPELADIQGPSLPDFIEARGASVLHVIGRLKTGVTLSVAHADLDRVIRNMNVEFGRAAPLTSSMTPLVDDLLGSVRVGLWALLSAVGLLLIAITANVTGLMLVQMAMRQREFAVRLALGASTAVLVLQRLVESGTIVLAAAVSALAVSRVALPAIQSIAGTTIPRADEAALDVRVIGFTVIVAALTCASCSIVPIWHIHRMGLEIGLRTVNRRVAPGSMSRAGRRWLVAIEVATAMATLAGAGLLYRSVERLSHLDLGFKPHNLLAVELGLPRTLRTGRSRADVFQFYTRAIDAVATTPFVESVAAVGQRPLKGPVGLDAAWKFEGQPASAARENPWVNLEPITPAYFTTIATHVIAGRMFDEHDRLNTEPVVIVNAKLAKYAWPGQSAIGKRIRGDGLNLGHRSDTWWTVVGVVPDIRYREIGATPLDVYMPRAQSWFPAGNLLLRTTVPPATIAGAVRTRLRQVDPDGIIDVVPMDRVVEAQEAPWRTNLRLFGVFAVLTVLVAGVGVFAMLAATVVEQSHEIGVRAALGATAWRIVRDVLGQGMQTVAAGLLVGVGTFLACSRFLRSMLFEINPVDGVTLVSAACSLITIAILACAVPAFRAARVDPAVCLRSE